MQWSRTLGGVRILSGETQSQMLWMSILYEDNEEGKKKKKKKNPGNAY